MELELCAVRTHLFVLVNTLESFLGDLRWNTRLELLAELIRSWVRFSQLLSIPVSVLGPLAVAA